MKRELNEPSEVQPTATQVSVTDMPWRSKAFARSMRRVMRYEYGVSPYAGAELAREVRGRHERGTRHRRDVERLRVLAVHEVARPAQVREVGDLLRRHTDDGTQPARPGSPPPYFRDHPGSPRADCRHARLAVGWVTTGEPCRSPTAWGRGRKADAVFSDVDSSPDPDRAVSYLEAAAERMAGTKRDLVSRLRLLPGERVLDVGCGAGHDLALLAATRAVAVGVDPSVRMARESRRRCAEAGVIVGDGASLACASRSLDACRIERVLQHVTDPLAMLAEVARVLRRDGRIVVFEPDWGSFALDSDRAAVGAAITNALMLGFRHPRVGLQLRGLLVRAGFVVEDVVVDVGRYTSIEEVRRFVDLDNVCGRAVESRCLQPGDVRSWLDEMEIRSERGAFQGTLNRMIAVARA